MRLVTSSASDDAASGLHRALSAASVVGLLATFRAVWLPATAFEPALGLAVSACYLAMFGLAVLTLCSTARRRLVRCDAAILGLAIVVEALSVVRYLATSFRYRVDEGILAQHALEAFRHGHNPYAAAWPASVAVAPTQLMNGHIVDRFDYPPVSLLVGYAGGLLSHPLASPTFECALALAAAAVIAFVMLPAQLRPLVVLVFFVISFETSRTLGGTPVIVAVPFLLAALMRWPDTGATGRLGRSGVIRAACLGLAAATQQLTWFVVPFVLVGLWRVRRAELSRADTAALLARYGAVGIASFAVVNAPFAVADPGRWWTGITGVLTQHAVLYGPGLAMVSGNITAGSGALGDFTVATGLFYLALLGGFAAGIRRLGPVMPLLPMVVYLLAIRSEDTYYLVFAPVWLLTAASLRPGAFEVVRPLRHPAWLVRSSRLKAATAVIGFLPAVGFAVAALVSRPPLDLRILATTASRANRVTSLTVSAANRSGHPVSPHFAFLVNARLGRYWKVASGPATIAPHETVQYLLLAPSRDGEIRVRSGTRLDAFSDAPQTLSSTGLP